MNRVTESRVMDSYYCNNVVFSIVVRVGGMPNFIHLFI